MRTLLIADDNVAAAEMLGAFLKDSYSLTTVHSAREALALLRNIVFDAAILDLGFPDMGPQEFAAALSEIMGRSKVIILTGYDIEYIEDQLRLIRPSAVLKKPATVENIMETLVGVIGAHGEQ